MNFRKAVLFLHLVAGLASAIFLILLGLSGALLVFESELDHALNARLARVPPQQGARLSLDALNEQIERAHPTYKVSGITLPGDDALAVNVSLRSTGKEKSFGVAVNPFTGEELGRLDTANTWMRNVHQFHTRLLLGDTGKLITGWSAIFLAGLSVSGLVLWWPRRLLRLSFSGSGRKTNFELHNVLGFYASLFMGLFALTGIVIHWEEKSRALADWLTGGEGRKPPPKAAPAVPGAVPVKADAVLAIAQQTVPGARVFSMQGLGALGNPIRVWLKFPEDGTPAGRTNLFLDPASGAVLSVQTSRTGPPGFRIANYWNREIHTGDIFGWPTRILACAASLALPVLALTGVLIWWGRIRRKGD